MQLLSLKQATLLVGVSRQTLYTWMNKGILPYNQIGSFRIFKREDVIAASELMDARPHGGTARKGQKN